MVGMTERRSGVMAGPVTVLLAVAGFAVVPPDHLHIMSRAPDGGDTPVAPFAEIYTFTLRATGLALGAAAAAELKPSHSPFGIAVDREGFLIQELQIKTRGLRSPATLGPYTTYVVWMTTPELDRTEKLGALDEEGRLGAQVSGMNKFMLMVTAEPGEEGEKRSGPIVLRGVSPSGLLTALGTHELFSNMPHDP
jgi:hypothetical protein